MARKKDTRKKNGASRKSAPKKTSPKKASAKKSKKGSKISAKDCNVSIEKAVAVAYREGISAGKATAAPAKSTVKKTSKKLKAAEKRARVEKKKAEAARAEKKKAEEQKKKAEAEAKKARTEAKKAKEEKKKMAAKTKKSPKKGTRKNGTKKSTKKAAKKTVAKKTAAAPKAPAKKRGRKKGGSKKTSSGRRRGSARKGSRKSTRSAASRARRPIEQEEKKYAASAKKSAEREKKDLKAATEKVGSAVGIADRATTAAAENEVAKTVLEATKETHKDTKLSKEMILAGKAPETKAQKLKSIAKDAMQTSTQFGRELRHAASVRAIKRGVVLSHLIGLIDSTQPFAKLDNKSLQKTGVGYKAWAGLGFLFISAGTNLAYQSNVNKQRSLGSLSNTRQLRALGAISDGSLDLATANLNLESYNLGVTRYSRVRNAVNSLLGRPVSEVTGVGALARRGAVALLGRPEASKRTFSQVRERFNDISPEDVSGLAAAFGLSEEDQDDIFGEVEEQVVPFFSPAGA